MNGTPRLEHVVLFQGHADTPLGRLTLAGEIRNGRGVVPARRLRVYGSYAVVCLLKGAGSYRDANGTALPLAAGDVFFVFPELGHWYGPGRGLRWDEFYLTFDGPVFDLWRRAGLLDPARPVLRPDDAGWIARLRALVAGGASAAAAPAASGSAAGRLRSLCGFVALLSELLLAALPENDDGGNGDGRAGAAAADARWLMRARGLLDTDLGRPIDLAAVAAEVGLSYENFRKRFQRAMGVSPARYRTVRRIEAARELLRYTPQMTNRQVAASLGFSDEYHFSKRFTQITGMTPRQLRRRTAAGGGGEAGPRQVKPRVPAECRGWRGPTIDGAGGTMEKRFDVFGMCNALFDIQAEVDDDVLGELKLPKGTMMLLSEEEQRAIVPRVYTHIVNTEAGGSGANTMIGLALLGATACYTSRVGDDEHGQMYRDGLAQQGVRPNLGSAKGRPASR
jgi:AraC-like DNA-binding protein